MLANAILLQQGTTATTPVVNMPNTTARIRAITSTNGLPASVTATNSSGASVTVLATSSVPQYSNYVVVSAGTLPTITVNGATITPFMKTSSGGSTAAVLADGGDYTLMVYVDGNGNPVAQFIEDNNTAPVAAQGVKFRLVNLAANSQNLQLSMSVNSINVASLIPYASASDYTELTTPQATNSVAEVFSGTDVIASHTQVMLLDNIFTDFVVSVDSSGNAKDFFRAASGT